MTPGAATRQHLFFEDFVAGRVFELGTRVLSEEEIVAFASEWDPQEFHVDPLAAARGPFDGLIASGWQTACVWMRLYVDAVLSRASMLTAPGIEELRWLQPVRPGMRLRGRATAYVCERGSCRLPTSDPTVFAAELRPGAR